MYPANYDDWKAGAHLIDDSEEPDPAITRAREAIQKRCATCADETELTHRSCYGELICTICAESDDWESDSLPKPQPR